MDTPAANGHDVTIDRPGDVRLDGGTSIDAEPAAALDAQATPENGDATGVFAYAFTPASGESSDDVP